MMTLREAPSLPEGLNHSGTTNWIKVCTGLGLNENPRNITSTHPATIATSVGIAQGNICRGNMF
jgi:hypothetical protein